MNICKNDLNILKDIAKRQREIAESDYMSNLKKKWLLHNTLRGEKPMITVELASFAGDILPQMLKCSGDDARNLEWMLLANIVNHELFKDDTVVKNYIPVHYGMWFFPFSLEVKIDNSHFNENSIGNHFVPQINDLQKDFYKLKKSSFGCNKDSYKTQIEYFNEIFGDILPAKLTGISLVASPMQNVIHLMDMQTTFMAIYDYPDLFKEMMENLSNDYLEYFDFLENEQVLLPTNYDQHVAQGTTAFTDELPFDKAETTKDLWGYLDSQETVGISSEMYEEFIFPYYKKISDRYGLLSYGCCEGVDFIWDSCLSKLPNLRKLSISSWCNEEIMGERLTGTKVIYHRKPNPTFLGVGNVLDEDGLRKHIAFTLKCAKNCKIEFSQRDVYRVSKSPEKVRKYVEIIREEIDNVF